LGGRPQGAAGMLPTSAAPEMSGKPRDSTLAPGLQIGGGARRSAGCREGSGRKTCLLLSLRIRSLAVQQKGCISDRSRQQRPAPLSPIGIALPKVTVTQRSPRESNTRAAEARARPRALPGKRASLRAAQAGPPRGGHGPEAASRCTWTRPWRSGRGRGRSRRRGTCQAAASQLDGPSHGQRSTHGVSRSPDASSLREATCASGVRFGSVR
jgi:hypothetical protein